MVSLTELVAMSVKDIPQQQWERFDEVYRRLQRLAEEKLGKDSISSIAKLCGVSYEGIRMCKTRMRFPGIAVISAMAEALGVEPIALQYYFESGEWELPAESDSVEDLSEALLDLPKEERLDHLVEITVSSLAPLDPSDRQTFLGKLMMGLAVL